MLRIHTRSKEKYRKTVNIIGHYKTSGIVITTLNYALIEFSFERIPVDQSREPWLTWMRLAAMNYNSGE